MSGFLDQAFAEAERRVQRWRHEDLLSRLRGASIPRRCDRSLAVSLRAKRRIALIAEIKRASPSKGSFHDSVDVAHQTGLYFDSGATAVSVLTESRWFGGSIGDLVAARRSTSGLLLRKDFIVNEYDLEVSAAAGADAILLIAGRFAASRLAELVGFARELGLEALVETHDQSDAAVACESGATVIGVNSRNLATLEVNFGAALQSLRRIPADRVRVLESGIQSPTNVRDAARAGANAVLVGEILMLSDDPATTIQSLLAEPDVAADHNDMVRVES